MNTHFLKGHRLTPMNPGEIGFALKWKAFHWAGTDYTEKLICV